MSLNGELCLSLMSKFARGREMCYEEWLIAGCAIGFAAFCFGYALSETFAGWVDWWFS